MKILSKILVLIGILFTGVSCNKFFDDMQPTDKVSDKVIWNTTVNAEYHINYLYSYVYDVAVGQSSSGVLTEAYTDMLKYGSYNNVPMGLQASQTAYGSSTTLSDNWVNVYLGNWGWYTGIRKCNNAISDLHQYGMMSDEDKLRLEAELKFTRAFLYFDLMKRYKEIILYDENMSDYTKDKALSTEEEGWEFIYKDLKFAAENLPDRTMSKGRADKGMAWAFMTRAMLYAKRYSDVVTAADEVAALGYDLEDSYEDAIKKDTGSGNNEAILQWHFNRGANITHSMDYYYTPGGDYAIHKQTGGGYGTPTQEMVESYEYATGGFPDWTKWHGTTTDTPPYAELEPRFHATILYNGAPWKNRTIEPFVDGSDGWVQWFGTVDPSGKTTTGYYLKKLADESHDVIAYSGGTMPLTIIRYAEVLLNKAEACYNLGADKYSEANAAVEAIRTRVGLPYTPKGGSELWNAIRQERRVELAFEGLWYWDLRRWGVAHKAYPEGLTGYQVHGLKIEKNADDTFTYTYVSVDTEDRNFPEKMYRFPLPSSELSNNGLVDQYEEWK
ncbi:MAG: RagB/SusD family nutrient uptake outer membrane protein [Bacteroidales bacterium]|nr:RagB/SusD family nutrient uptake outer membrane protein [Bacteroidales bacterium]